jgi:hypothetical protein
MALQVEDLLDCFVILESDMDFFFIFDQSTGHGQLPIHDMNVDWNGAVPPMHSTVVNADRLGPNKHPDVLHENETQEMSYHEFDQGPLFKKRKG